MTIPMKLLHFDRLSFIMIALIVFVTFSVASFSSRYLKGDKKYFSFYINSFSLMLSIILLVSADNFFVFLLAWAVSNFLLSRLMLHKSSWEAAKQSSILALKNFSLGLFFLILSFTLLYIYTGKVSIYAISQTVIEQKWVIFSSSILLILAAMTQSAIWPFHKWMLSSLNSPTPVSALMHAGLINGGGFLLARFAHLFLNQETILNIIFIIGMMTAIIGTFWKLIQSDVKRMLACSTIAQMGFMIVQCGLGLFPAAIAHLCCHGLFKAHLFLSSDSIIQEKRFDLKYPPSIKHLLLAFIFGVSGAYIFAVSSGKIFFSGTTNDFLITISMIAGTQLALPIISSKLKTRFILSLLIPIFMGATYGASIRGIHYFLKPLDIYAPQPMNFLHIISLIFLIAAWIFVLFFPYLKHNSYPKWFLKLYVYMLNSSQPDPRTITSHRNKYQF